MLTNPNEESYKEFKIKFGNLKRNLKDNYYLATDERAYENKIVNCMFLIEKINNKYVIVVENLMDTRIVKYINLDYFEEWHYVCDN